ncbi:hypothetical protein [Gordonia otitidis]|uniref:hypothetical protein n=1 Tax=Gordonia otitidis TaxID=249058 RepID=UPI002ACDCFD5|nr:hypothetical protein [Gordonia otitidis]
MTPFIADDHGIIYRKKALANGFTDDDLRPRSDAERSSASSEVPSHPPTFVHPRTRTGSP